MTRRVRVLGVAAAVAAAAWLLWSIGREPVTPVGLVSTPLDAPAEAAPAHPAGRTPPPQVEPDPGDERAVAVAELMSRLLSGAPELDPQHLGAMIDRATDPEQPARERLSAIRWLARFGNDEALDVLERMLRDEEPPIRAAIARALGDCRHPDALRVLTELLDDEDPVVAANAAHALGAQPSPEAAESLRTLLAAAEPDSALYAAAESALGRHPLGEDVSSAQMERLRAAMGDSDLPVRRKVEMIEMLEDGSPEATQLLLDFAQNGSDPRIRSAAVGALTSREGAESALAALGRHLGEEPSPDVRADVYSTLTDNLRELKERDALVGYALSETAPRPRLESYRMVAVMLHQRYEPALAETFDGNMVAWLATSAERAPDRYTSQLSIYSLNLAGTPASRDALEDLRRSGDPRVAASAEKALQKLARADALN